MLFKIEQEPFGEPLFEKAELECSPGVTLFTGCNGYGKTTLLNTIRRELACEDKDSFQYSAIKSYDRSRGYASYQEKMFAAIAGNSCFSEGESIVNDISAMARVCGEYAHKGQKELFHMFDSFDSGLSIDNIEEMCDFFELIISESKKAGQEPYIFCAINSYDFVYRFPDSCIDARTLEPVKFDGYEDYRKYIMETHKKKNKRKSRKRKK